MSAKISPPFDYVQGLDLNEDIVAIHTTNERELAVKSRDSDNTIIIKLLMEIRDLLIELND